jgi:Zn-dependent M28 family amino/carboxypeptidase
VQTSLHPFNSDHVPFIDTSIPAVLTIEGTDDANHNIHTADDTLDHIDYDLALQIVRMNVATTASALDEASPCTRSHPTSTGQDACRARQLDRSMTSVRATSSSLLRSRTCQGGDRRGT